ncbi:hypothetical protein GCM10009863_42440 [Streptomyces axinellae]|uniref:Cupin type-2 domain-containing protein n=1 Tax=Streptomyces axinellae TaxID=552788 RepID=A0ABN3QDG8_9ACTN
MWLWRLEPGEDYPSHPRQAGVVETVSVTSGQMVLVLDGTEHPGRTGRTGQTATFDGDTPRTYRGAGDETCHLIMTVHLPLAPPHLLTRPSHAHPAAAGHQVGGIRQMSRPDDTYRAQPRQPSAPQGHTCKRDACKS